MRGGPVARMLADGRRLHLQQGPIDLIIGAEGAGREQALASARVRFDGLLQGLVDELPLLRRRVDAGAAPEGDVARAMWRAALPHGTVFVTPMAAVAVAVADAILAAMVAGAPGLSKAHVNNGGDIAFHLAPGAALVAAVAGGGGTRLRVRAADRARGIATSGWRGRSHSLGIADAVTVLARDAAAADVAATLLANAVDLPGHPAIRREPASALAPDSDLGARAVTVAVGALTAAETLRALERGAAAAAAMAARGLIDAAALMLNGQRRILGPLALEPIALHPDEREKTHA